MNIQVNDVQTGQDTLFVADQWIAIEKGTIHKQREHFFYYFWCIPTPF